MTDTPFVSCIMPTFNRRQFVPYAIDYFLRQEYDAKELIVVDDGSDAVADLIPDDPRVRYIRLDARMALGAKRNLACEEATGEVIVHWDDDDWSASWRLGYQVEHLVGNEADVCGLRSLLFYEPRADRGWKYSYPTNGRPWVAGGTLCYAKDLWRRHRFPEIRQGEDTQFIWGSKPRRLVALEDQTFYVALIHRENTSRKNTSSRRWSAVPGGELRSILGEDAARYGEGDGVVSIGEPVQSMRSAPPPEPRRVLVGIQTHSEPRRLAATISSVAEFTEFEHSLILLPDGATEATRAAIAASGLPSSESAGPRGRAACFNRLVRHAEADVYVLLESGVRVSQGWLTRLIAGLDAHPDNGLAGPTTNNSWNEQGRYPDLRGTKSAISGAARQLAQRFGAATSLLKPLYSLGDFCFAVRKEVVETIGAADEGYGLGPCWEMDYNVRAARAGFRGVWVRGAYVHRAPPTARRRRNEARYFDASRARYQAKFCMLCPRSGATSAPATHCRGDGCRAFAPADLIQIRMAFPDARSSAEPDDVSATPLVSCIMPTTGRHLLARRAVEYFRRQTYPNLELVIVDDGPRGLEDFLPDDSRIRYLRVANTLSIGEKRNLACRGSNGGIIVQWDDDDWYGVERVARQVDPIIDGRADMTGLTGGLFLDVPKWRLLKCSAEVHRQMFAEDVIGGTLAFDKSVLGRTGYPDRSVGEDAHFLRRAIRRGARLERVANEGLFVYVRHGDNTWHFPLGRYLGEANWSRVDDPILPAEDAAFYRELQDKLKAT